MTVSAAPRSLSATRVIELCNRAGVDVRASYYELVGDGSEEHLRTLDKSRVSHLRGKRDQLLALRTRAQECGSKNGKITVSAAEFALIARYWSTFQALGPSHYGSKSYPNADNSRRFKVISGAA